DSLYEKDISPDDVRRELEMVFRESEIPIIFIDEYNKISNEQCNVLMANLIKALSDYSVNVTLVIIGVADNVNELIGQHHSIARCIEQIPMPRMDIEERKQILEKIIPRLGLKIEPDAIWKIVHLSRGLPAYVHSLSLYAVHSATDRRSLTV